MASLLLSLSVSNATANFSGITDSNHTIELVSDAVLVCTIICSCLSVFGANMIFVTHCIVNIEEQQREIRRFLVYLTVSDLMIAVGNLMGSFRYIYINTKFGDLPFDRYERWCVNSDEICIVQSAITVFGSISSYFWTVMIGVHILLLVRYESEFTFRRGVLVVVHCICWGSPAAVTVFALFNEVLGDNLVQGTSCWCWIKRCLDKPSHIVFWMTFAGKGWEILAFLVAMCLYVLVKIFMIKQRRTATNRSLGFADITNNRLRNEDENFCFVWITLYVLRIWGTIRFVLTVSNVGNGGHLERTLQGADKILQVLQGIGDSLQAFCTFILCVVFDRNMRKGVYDYLRNNVSRGETTDTASSSDRLLNDNDNIDYSSVN